MTPTTRRVEASQTITLALALGGVVAIIGVLASRAQLPDAGPGILSVTIPVPALLLLLVAAAVAAWSGSFRTGAAVALVGSIGAFGGVFAVVATEGVVWMQEVGVFILDGDPPRTAVDDTAVALDLLSSGMWVGHLVVWILAIAVGAALGAGFASRRAPERVRETVAAR